MGNECYMTRMIYHNTVLVEDLTEKPECLFAANSLRDYGPSNKFYQLSFCSWDPQA